MSNQLPTLQEFLNKEGFSEYEQLLTQCKFDFKALLLANETHLEKIGIPLGDILKILDALNRYKQGMYLSQYFLCRFCCFAYFCL
jgi:hypothetical protein